MCFISRSGRPQWAAPWRSAEKSWKVPRTCLLRQGLADPGNTRNFPCVVAHKELWQKDSPYAIFRLPGTASHVPGSTARKEKKRYQDFSLSLMPQPPCSRGSQSRWSLHSSLPRRFSTGSTACSQDWGMRDFYARRWSRNDILRWAHRPVSVWNPSKKQKDRVALDRCGRSLLFSHVLRGVPGSDPET